MSRTYNQRGRFWRRVKNSYMQKMANEYGYDFYHRRKDRNITKKVRTREKKRDREEIKEAINEI